MNLIDNNYLSSVFSYLDINSLVTSSEVHSKWKLVAEKHPVFKTFLESRGVKCSDERYRTHVLAYMKVFVIEIRRTQLPPDLFPFTLPVNCTLVKAYQLASKYLKVQTGVPGALYGRALEKVAIASGLTAPYLLLKEEGLDPLIILESEKRILTKEQRIELALKSIERRGWNYSKLPDDLKINQQVKDAAVEAGFPQHRLKRGLPS